MRLYKEEYDPRWYLEFKLPGKDRPLSLAHFNNDWPQLFKRGEYNWRNFTFINLSFEDDIMLGGFEIEAALLGFGVRIRLGIRKTERMEELQQRVEDIKDGTAGTISLDEFMSRLGDMKQLPPGVECTCYNCDICERSMVICGVCNMCTVCYGHKDGCPGCPAEI